MLRYYPFFFLVCLLCMSQNSRTAPPPTSAYIITNPTFLSEPQWTTSSRLLKLGESIEFRFFLPAGTDPGELKIFPRYLEQANPGCDFNAAGDLSWLNQLPFETIPLSFSGGQAVVTYQPAAAGNYLARWQVNGELFYRYFSVIQDDYAVIRFGGYYEFGTNPTMHPTGIPVDFPLPIAQFQIGNPLYQTFLDHHRHYGDLIAVTLADTPNLSEAERLAQYTANMAQARSLLPDYNDSRCARIEMWHNNDPGYAQVLTQLDVNSHFGLQMANGGSWLGMPEFPYFVSSLDLRKVNQQQGGDLVTHQWDFCGGWHFLGPTSWLYQMSANNWKVAGSGVSQGVAEAALLAKNSGHPAFIFPLYDGNIMGTSDGLKFVDAFQRFVAFSLPKRYKVVFSRAIDISDYYRRHFPVTPRTVFISKTENPIYDIQWHNIWAGRHESLAREQIPWLTRMSTVLSLRNTHHGAKDPLSCEYMVVEDQKRSMRFERRSPHPIWWFDYTNQESQVGPDGSTIRWVEPPNVDVLCTSGTITPSENLEYTAVPRWQTEGLSLKTQLKMKTNGTYTDYAITVWDLPDEFTRNPDPAKIQTNAKDFILAKNLQGEYHLVLVFDLLPDFVLNITLNLTN